MACLTVPADDRLDQAGSEKDRSVLVKEGGARADGLYVSGRLILALVHRWAARRHGT